MPSLRLPLTVRLILGLIAAGGIAGAAEPAVRVVAREKATTLVAASAQPVEYRYLAFPALLERENGAVWIAYKAGRTHATDPGAAMEVVQHAIASGETRLVQRLPAPPPKLYQMGEFARFADGSVGLHVDVQSVGWDGRHYRSGAEVFRWNAARQAFDAPTVLPPVNGVLYGYPFDFITEGRSTWQLIMSFGYHQPGGRWGVDALRSDDNGRTWNFVRNLTTEFGGIQGNECGLVRHGDGFIVASRAYDRIARLHRTDREFRVKHQADLTGKYAFVNSYVGRPRVFVRDGHGYLIGRNWTRPIGANAQRGETASEMQLCLLRFDLETLALTSCVILDNAENQKVTDGYYPAVTFSGMGDATRLHVFTYKALNSLPPDIVRLDYRWADVK